MIVLDSNVVSELMRPAISPAVVAWMSGQAAVELFTTTITVAEILYGVEIAPKGKRRDQLLKQAEATFSQDFAGHILSFDESAARMYASIASVRRSRGRPISVADAQIAAIARAQGATLATRNGVDFEGCGIALVNPWHT